MQEKVQKTPFWKIFFIVTLACLPIFILLDLQNNVYVPIVSDVINMSEIGKHDAETNSLILAGIAVLILGIMLFAVIKY